MAANQKESAGVTTLIVVALLLCLFAAPPLAALTFYVNSAGDGPDQNVPDGRCDASAPQDQCTLRAALLQANASQGKDEIQFVLPPGTRIAVGRALPTITDPLVIDGDGAVVLDGAAAGADANGLWLSAGGSTVRGLVIQSFSAAGILVTGPGGNFIEGNRIGTDAAGQPALGNGKGVRVSGSPGNTIGGLVPADPQALGKQCVRPCNLISGNREEGVLIDGASATRNFVQGNFIGTDLTGTLDRGNQAGGVRCDSPSNFIGGVEAGAGNLISGNNATGVILVGSGSRGNAIEGNFIGTTASGTEPLGNDLDGVLVTEFVGIAGAPAENRIGGVAQQPWDTCKGACNVISGNKRHGIFLYASGTEGNRVQDNFIGTDVTGQRIVAKGSGQRLGNLASGVLISYSGAAASSAPNNTIGGTAAGEGNLISGNLQDGVQIDGGGKQSKVWGNRIGTDVTGMQAQGNGRDGVAVIGPSGVRIGGARPGEACTGPCNLISGNGRLGVYLRRLNDSLTTSGNFVLGNFIGTDLAGIEERKNGFTGVRIENAAGNFIGEAAGTVPTGPCSGSCNLISGNGEDGIVIGGDRATGNRVQGNYIGVQLNGLDARPNARTGVLLTALSAGGTGASDNDIGGASVGEGNLISGNLRDGIQISGGASRNRVQGNRIGTDRTGTKKLGNRRDGIGVYGAADNQIGWIADYGSCPAPCNVISGNEGHGVRIAGTATAGASGNKVRGNFIGTHEDGMQPLGNGGHGVLIESVATGENAPTTTGNFIGASRPTGSEVCEGPCNLIVANTQNGVMITGAKTEDNHVEGNFIGLKLNEPKPDALDRSRALPNGLAGVLVTRGAARNRIGGERAAGSKVCDGPCNVISGNTGAGIGIAAGASGTRIEGNFVGVTPDGVGFAANGAHGVFVSDREAAEVDGVVDAEAAYAIAAGFNNRKIWPAQVDAHAFACRLKTEIIVNGKDPNGYLKWQGFLFEVLATQEFGWVRSPTPGTPEVDAIEVDAEDGRAKKWQMKSLNSAPCSKIASLLTAAGPDLVLPRDREGECADPVLLKRVLYSKAISYVSVRGRIQTFVNASMKKSDCPVPDVPAAVETRLNVIGGTRASAACDGRCNVLAGNTGFGVALDGEKTSGNLVAGNYIGLAPAPLPTLSSFDLANEQGGVRVFNAPANTIGGHHNANVCDGECNLISGNGLTGVVLRGQLTTGVQVTGNFIGVQPHGLAPLGNGMAGVAIMDGARSNALGGAERSTACDGTCNVISGNGTDGVLIWGPSPPEQDGLPNLPGTSENRVQGNYIGVGSSGSTAVHNGHHGVAIEEGASSTVVGIEGIGPIKAALCAGTCNVIRGNGEIGVAVIGDITVFNTIRGNSLFGNGGQPIDLAGDGPTRNDLGDSDSGPNEKMNYPRLHLFFDGTSSRISGTLETPNPAEAVVDIYEGDQADPARLLYSAQPDAAGNFALDPVPRKIFDVIGMATNGNGSSSELASVRRPVVFIPGASGSTLVDRGDELWLGLGSDHRRLSLFSIDRDPAARIVASDVLRSVYGPLLSKLIEDGYREYKVPEPGSEIDCDLSQREQHPTLFAFAYDWRLDLVLNAERLREYLGCIRRFHPETEIDIVAHSMGGLLARRYVLDHLADHGVRKLITVGTPFLGLPKAIDVLETGDFSLLQPLFRETGRYIAGSFTGGHQLLPAQAYCDLVDRMPDGSPFKLLPLIEAGWDFNDNGKINDEYSYAEYVSAVDKRYGKDDSSPPRKEYSPASDAQLFHRPAQDDWSAGGSGIELHHLYGIDPWDVTIGQLRAIYGVECARIPLPSTCHPARTFFPMWTRGDGTVPLLSAERCVRPDDDSTCTDPGLNDPLANRVPIEGSLFSPLTGSADHIWILRNENVQQLILRFLTSGDIGASQVQARAASVAFASVPLPLPAYRLILTGTTPVMVRDDAGHSTLPSAEEPAGTLPEAHVHALGEVTEAVTAPGSGMYSVAFQAAGRPIGIDLMLGTLESTTLAVRYHDLDLPAGANARLRLTPNGPEDLRYDADGDGTFETAVAPTVSVTGAAAADHTPPRIEASWAAEPEALRVTLTASDDASGVGEMFYSLDGSTFQPYVSPVAVDPVASPVLYAFADDGVANRGVLVYPLPVTDLAVSLTASPDRVVIGSDLTYALTVANQGAQATRDVTVRIALPAGVRVLSCTVSGGTCGGSEGAPVVTFPSLAAGGTAGATLVARVDCSFSDGAPIAATATVSSALFDPNGSNNTATATATVLNTITISPTEQSVPPGGGSGGLDVSAPAACGWTAVSQAPFLTVVFGASGTGIGWVSFTVDANPSTAPRTGTLLVVGRTFTVTQEACSYTLSSTSQSFPARGGTGSFQVSAPAGCSWAATTGDAFITVSASGSGDGTVEYAVAANPDHSPRTGSIHLADQTFTVSQEGVPCAYTIALAPAAQVPPRPAADRLPIDFGEHHGQLTERAALLVQGFLSGFGLGSAHAMAMDAAGDIYLTGETWSPADFRGTVGPDLTFNGGVSDAFVAKIRGDGSGVVYAGYIGGGSTDVGLGIAVDASGSAYVTGYTYGGFLHIPSDSSLVQSGLSDAFVAKINPAGTAFLYLGFLGGQSYDNGLEIAVDGAGNAYVTGHTYTPEAYGFPVRTGPDLTFNGPLGGRDAFVAKVRADGRALDYAGYLGGDKEDGGSGIAVDATGSAYITGYTSSRETTFPVVGGPDLTLNGPTTLFDAFVAKVKPDGTGLEYCGYLGGSQDDLGRAIAVDDRGSAYVTGVTTSREDTFPVIVGPGLSYQGGSPGGSADAFVAKVAPNGLSLSYCGYLGGGNLSDEGRGITVDAAGNAYVTGYTAGGFPVLGGLDASYNGNYTDAFVTKVNAEGTGLVYSGYLGGTGVDYGQGIAVNGAGTAYVAGYTNSTANGSFDAFLAGIESQPGLALFLTGSPYAAIAGNQLTYKITVTNDSGQIEEDVVITDELPAELTLVSATATGGGVLGGSGNHVTVRFPSLAPGASASFTLVTQVSCSAPNFSSLTNTATVTSSTSGPVSSNTLDTGLSNPAALSPVSQSFTPEAGSGQLTVTMPPACDWTAVSDAPWLHITSGGSGRGNGVVLYTVDANGSAARTGTIRVGDKTLTVTQTGTGSECQWRYAQLTPSATFNGTLTTGDCQSPIRPGFYAERYTLGTGWQASVKISLASSDFDTWFFLIDPSSSHNIVAQGTGHEGYSYWLSAPGGGAYTLEVTSASPGQTGGYTLTLEDSMACTSFGAGTPSPSSFLAAGGTGTVWGNAQFGCLWTVASDVPWISLSAGGGQGQERISFTLAPNLTTGARTGTLTFTLAARNISATATVTQEAAPPLTTSFPAIGGTGEVRVTTDGDCPWTAASNDSWITVLAGGQGSGNGSVTYAVAPNPGASPRTGSLSIAGGILIVHQEKPAGADFYTVPPCRIADTRGPAGPYGGPALAGGGERRFTLAGRCGIPASARAVSLNVTVTAPTSAGHLTLYPHGITRPLTSTINYRPGGTRANNTILKLGEQGELTVFVGQAPGGTVHLILDVNGYFE